MGPMMEALRATVDKPKPEPADAGDAAAGKALAELGLEVARLCKTRHPYIVMAGMTTDVSARALLCDAIAAAIPHVMTTNQHTTKLIVRSIAAASKYVMYTNELRALSPARTLNGVDFGHIQDCNQRIAQRYTDVLMRTDAPPGVNEADPADLAERLTLFMEMAMYITAAERAAFTVVAMDTTHHTGPDRAILADTARLWSQVVAAASKAPYSFGEPMQPITDVRHTVINICRTQCRMQPGHAKNVVAAIGLITIGNIDVIISIIDEADRRDLLRYVRTYGPQFRNVLA